MKGVGTVPQEIQESSRSVIERLMEQYGSSLLRMCTLYLKDADLAQDAVQETFIKVWQRIRDLDEQKTIGTWIYTIASRLCIDKLRRTNRIVSMPEDQLALRRLASDNDNHRTLENREWVSIVRTMAEGLSDKQRLVFTLCQLEDLSSAEVEQITGLDAKQVKSNLYMARQTIRKRLKELGYE